MKFRIGFVANSSSEDFHVSRDRQIIIEPPEEGKSLSEIDITINFLLGNSCLTCEYSDLCGDFSDGTCRYWTDDPDEVLYEEEYYD